MAPETSGSFYIERVPEPALRPYVRMLWYSRLPALSHPRERILPNGCAQIVISLAREFLLDCTETAEAPNAPALIVGPRSAYELISTSDLADLVGAVFEPAMLSAFVNDRADLFTHRNTPVRDLWTPSEDDRLRSRMRESRTPSLKLKVLEQWLSNRVRAHDAHPSVQLALRNSNLKSHDLGAATGWSERRINQVFREQIGFSPKTWERIQRFQTLLRALKAARHRSIAELAAECGYYDQPHLANEFRRISGITLTTYLRNSHKQWTNHTIE